jgi:hypothetical protein
MGKSQINTDENSSKVFNTPLEVGLRALIILKVLDKEADLERLMFFDYLSLNTYDIGGSESIHAPIPNRGVQVYARKDIMQKGITIFLAKELIEFMPTRDGFLYRITKAGVKFLEYFESEYFLQYVDRVMWVALKFPTQTNEQIKDFIKEHLHEWGSEFLITDFGKL